MGIGPGEFIALAVLAIIILGPEKLPRYAAEAGRMLRNLRGMASDAKAEVRKELGPEFSDFSLSDLTPKGLVRKHLLDPIDIDSLDGPDERAQRRPAPPRAPAGDDGDGTPAADDPPRYDPDAT
jgi:sec-independent protein translocase protein TatB